jgi:hypothetical protein
LQAGKLLVGRIHPENHQNELETILKNFCHQLKNTEKDKPRVRDEREALFAAFA